MIGTLEIIIIELGIIIFLMICGIIVKLTQLAGIWEK